MQNEQLGSALLGSAIAPETTGLPRIYVACLCSYNAGILHGRWIGVTDIDEVWSNVQMMLKHSPEEGAEEWAIHDYDGFCGVEISEYASFETVVLIADFVREHGDLGAKLLANFGGDLDEARSSFSNYAGHYETIADFAQGLTEQSGTTMPENIAPYIDYEAMGRDLELGGEVFTIETGSHQFHIFWSR